MKRFFLKTAASALSLCAFLSIPANAQQDFRTGYFLDGYMNRTQFNPAFWGEYNYFTPAIGNAKVGFDWNTPMNTLIGVQGGKYTSVFDSAISWDDIAPIVPGRLNCRSNASLDILSTGFWAGATYSTISLSLRGTLGVNAPSSALKFIKVGSSDGTSTYDIDNFNASGDAFMEASYGISFPITDWLRMGMKFKFLMGIAHMDMNATAHYQKSGSSWMVDSQGQFNMSLPNMTELPLSPNGYDFDNISFPQKNIFLLWKGGLPGIGGALDLGFTADFANYFTVSVAATDIGFMSWTNLQTATTFGNTIYTPTRDPGAEAQPVRQLVEGGYALIDSFGFVDDGIDFSSRKSKWLATTLNSSLEFRLPFYQRMSIGLLGTFRLGERKLQWWEARASLNWALLSCLSFSGSYGYSSCGQSAGVALNLHCKGFNFFAGMDSFLPLITRDKPFVPTFREFNTGMSAGINFTFGKKHSRYGKNVIMPPFRKNRNIYVEEYQY